MQGRFEVRSDLAVMSLPVLQSRKGRWSVLNASVVNKHVQVREFRQDLFMKRYPL